MSKKIKMNVNSLSRPLSKKLKKIRETKQRQASRQETAEEISRRRSALKYEYFRQMSPFGEED